MGEVLHLRHFEQEFVYKHQEQVLATRVKFSTFCKVSVGKNAH